MLGQSEKRNTQAEIKFRGRTQWYNREYSKKFMSVKKFSQAPLTLCLVLVQHLQRLFMIDVKFGEYWRDGSAIIVLLEELATELGVLQILDIRGENLLSIVTDEGQIDCIYIDGLMCQCVISDDKPSRWGYQLTSIFCQSIASNGMRWDQAYDCDGFEQGMSFEKLQELSRNVTLADSFINDKLGYPPNYGRGTCG